MSQLRDLLLERVSPRTIFPVAQYRGAVEQGWYDLITRFRRAYLGLLWIPFQQSLWICVISLVLYDRLGEGLYSYFVYLGVGFYVWEFLSGAIGEGPAHFTSKVTLLKNVPVKLSYLTVRRVSFICSRSLLQLPVPVILVLAFGEVPNPLLLLVLPPLAIFMACFAYGCLVILGIIGCLYRDTAFLNAAFLRFLFFTSPIFWRGDVGIRKAISTYNPIAYFLDIARAPFEGYVPSLLDWLVVASVSMGCLAVGLWAQSTFRNRLIYWL